MDSFDKFERSFDESGPIIDGDSKESGLKLNRIMKTHKETNTKLADSHIAFLSNISQTKRDKR